MSVSLGTLYLVRHGESIGNVWKNGYYDDRRNFLSPFGVQQAELCGSYFDKIGLDFAHVFSSDLTRARHTTSSILYKMHDWKRHWEIDPRFNEMTPDEVKNKDPGLRVKDALDDVIGWLEDGDVLLVSHYHVMQHIFDFLPIQRSKIDETHGKHVGNAQPYSWVPNTDHVKFIDMSKNGRQY